MIRESPGERSATAFPAAGTEATAEARPENWGKWPVLAACWLACACHAFTAAPAVNESHYLTKAKKLLEPAWCLGDLFLESAPAQLLFFSIAGGMSRLMSLEAVAWTGRAVCWLGMATAFQYLLVGAGIRGWLVPAFLVLTLVLNESCHLAGEWFVGGFEAKAIAWPLLTAAIGAGVRGKWTMAWSLAASATAFHFVVGWWGLVCIGIVRVALRGDRPGLTRRWRDWLSLPGELLVGGEAKGQTGLKTGLVLIAVCGGLLAGAIPAVVADWSATAGERQSAAEIQVAVRLPHHLLFGAFPTERVARFAAMLVIWWIAGVRLRGSAAARQVWLVALAAVGLDLVGLVLSAVFETGATGHELAARLLRLYWFRMADVLVPVSIAVSAGVLMQRWTCSMAPGRRLIASLVGGLLLVAGAIKGLEQFGDRVPPADRLGIASQEVDENRIEAVANNWQRVCDWIRQSTPADALFLTPGEGSSFAWHAGRAEWFSWKHAPQDALGLVEWNRRRALAEQARQYLARGGSFEVLASSWLRPIPGNYGIDYVVMFQRDVGSTVLPDWLEQVYPAAAGERTTFVVLKVR